MRTILIISVLTCAYFFPALSQQTVNDHAAPVNSQPSNSVVIPDVIVFPVVVHVLYNTPEQNISNEQIASQIKVLNQDFRKKNADAAYIPAAFRELAADSRIEFRLATIDPSGLSTNGIIRKSTHVTAFIADDKIKSTLLGGDDPWNRDQYLNLWVGNLSGGVMGYASLPGSAAEKDGVVIKYSVFGSTGNMKAPYNKGRTTVHEVGHWLGLRHIWGDTDCGDDKIDDTPPQAGPTRGCPSGVIATCSSGAAGNMYMNFMDFTNDECTNMFTAGQATRMRELFQYEGARYALLSSNKAEGALSDEELVQVTNGTSLTIYPNPAISELQVMLPTLTDGFNKIFVYNNLGQVVKAVSISGNKQTINVSDLKAGLYFVTTGGKEIAKFIKR
jgi:hypothetical protein